MFIFVKSLFCFLIGDAEGSYSSRMSNKSEKNMADFDGEDSVCEEELAQLNRNLLTIAHTPEKVINNNKMKL